MTTTPTPASQPKHQANGEPCTVPPEGWYCTREIGHDGPCAAYQIDETANFTAQEEAIYRMGVEDGKLIARGMARLKAGAKVQPSPARSDIPDTEREWRRLALQFDGHRMQALSYLRMLSERWPNAEVQAFLAAPPLPGEAVLAERLAALAAQGTQPERAPESAWHDAVLAECMRIETGYHANDPVATLKALINWHYQEASGVAEGIKIMADNYVKLTCSAESAPSGDSRVATAAAATEWAETFYRNADSFTLRDLGIVQAAWSEATRRATAGNAAPDDIVYAYECLQPGGQNIWCEFFSRQKPELVEEKWLRNVRKYAASNAATAAPERSEGTPGDLPIFCYTKQVHSGWPEFNKEDEFSDGEGGGDALVKLADVEKLLASNAGAAPTAYILKSRKSNRPDEHLIWANDAGNYSDALYSKEPLTRAPSNNSPIGAQQETK